MPLNTNYAFTLLNETYKQQIIDFYTVNKVYVEKVAIIRSKYAIFGLNHTPTNSLIAISSAKIKYSKDLNGYYYFYSIFSLPGHNTRPKLFHKTFNYLETNRKNGVKGVAVHIVNPRITPAMVHWGGLESVNNSIYPIFYKDFS